MQVLILLFLPYCDYKQYCKEEHKDGTIGEFVEYVDSQIGVGFVYTTLIPFIGFILVVGVAIIACILMGLDVIYNKYIKNIKI